MPEQHLVAVNREIIDRPTVIIDRDNPMTPDEYREQVWIPYLENRYSTDAKAS